MDADHVSKHFRRLLGNLPVNLPVNYFSIYTESIPIAYKQEMLDCHMKCDTKCQENLSLVYFLNKHQSNQMPCPAMARGGKVWVLLADQQSLSNRGFQNEPFVVQGFLCGMIVLMDMHLLETYLSARLPEPPDSWFPELKRII